MNQGEENRICRVLLVDDSDAYLRALAKLLSREKDLSVVGEASDGRAAIAQATKLRPDVIIMDIMMTPSPNHRRHSTVLAGVWSFCGPDSLTTGSGWVM